VQHGGTVPGIAFLTSKRQYSRPSGARPSNPVYLNQRAGELAQSNAVFQKSHGAGSSSHSATASASRFASSGESAAPSSMSRLSCRTSPLPSPGNMAEPTGHTSQARRKPLPFQQLTRHWPTGKKASLTSYSFSLVARAEFIPQPVPEPTTFLLLGSGLMGLAALRKHWKIPRCRFCVAENQWFSHNYRCIFGFQCVLKRSERSWDLIGTLRAASRCGACCAIKDGWNGGAGLVGLWRARRWRVLCTWQSKPLCRSSRRERARLSATTATAEMW